MEKIILFDGVCNLCNSSVNFIIDRDPDKHFKFASIQSETGQGLLKNSNFRENTELLKSVVYIEGDRTYYKSSAALRIAKHLSSPWNYLYLLIVIPPFMRDFFYDLVAKHRYKFFGKSEACRMPSPKTKDRFL